MISSEALSTESESALLPVASDGGLDHLDCISALQVRQKQVVFHTEARSPQMVIDLFGLERLTAGQRLAT